MSGTEHTGTSLKSLSWYGKLLYNEKDEVGMGRFTENGVEYLSFSRLFTNGWLFSVQIPVRELFAGIERKNNQFTLIILTSFFVLLILTSFLLSRLINRPLHKLTSGVAELGGGNLDKQIEIKTKDEFGTLAAAFNKMTVDLKASIEQSAMERAEKERIGAELGVATTIQASMLPCIFPAFPHRAEFDIYASMQPAKEVGGDFYDFFLVDERTLAVIMADVSGKGIPAALFMVIAKTLIKNNAQYGKIPKEVFETVNNLLCENNDADMFVTAFLGYLDIPTGRFTYVNAGHNPPLIKRGERFEWLKDKPGFVLAGMEDMFYKQYETALKTGDELFLYTDGVTEAVNKEDELFSDPRLLEVVNGYLNLPLKEFTISVKREIDKFADGAEQADDITMLALRYMNPNLEQWDRRHEDRRLQSDRRQAQ
jgi:sigma-B regulation protein RsbU (phosphoserine phosphatase)